MHAMSDMIYPRSTVCEINSFTFIFLFLQPVEDRTPAPQEDTRGDLLSEIRKGCKLRPVDERDIKPVSNSPMSKSDDLACALARALAKRSEVIHSEDDDDMSDSTNSDWED